MKNNRFNNFCLGVVVGAAIITLAVCVLISVVPPKRTTKAQEYDLWCVAEIRKDTLSECKK